MRRILKFGLPLMLALAAAASPAVARDHGRGHDNDRGRGHSSYQDRDHRRGHDRDRYDRHDRYDRRDRVSYRYVAPRPVYRHDYRPSYRHSYRPVVYAHPRWARGARYYGPGYGPTYVVSDYGYYGLRHPPRGYGWRRDDRGDFLLVALATGIIADLVIHGGY
jgi:Ni/Co efflux regulator RcnB